MQPAAFGDGRARLSSCQSLCHSIVRKRVATGSHALDESLLFGLLTHQLKATDCNGLDGSNHPLKVKTRVRTPYGLSARNPRSAATFSTPSIALQATAATHFATQSGRIASTRSPTWAVARRGALGRCGSAEVVTAPWTERNTSRMWCHVNLLEPPRRPSSRWGAALASTQRWESMTLTRPYRGRPRGPTHWGARETAHQRRRAVERISGGDGGVQEEPHLEDAWATEPSHVRGRESRTSRCRSGVRQERRMGCRARPSDARSRTHRVVPGVRRRLGRAVALVASCDRVSSCGTAPDCV
jgi:hypothetical protein